MKDIRSQFPIFNIEINGHPLIYFDNAATSQKPEKVIEEIKKFYESANSNVHRSINPLAELSTNLFEFARKKVANYIHAQSPQEIVFTRNATESINLVAKTWGRAFLSSKDRIVLPLSEHHSNIIPWLQLKREKNIELHYIPLEHNGALNMGEAKKLLSSPKVKMLTLAHATNTQGIIHPIEELIKIAKKYGITTIIDASQTAPHIPIDVQKFGCDFLAFSGHKMYGPTGIGALWGRKEILEKMPEFLGGGEMIHEVFEDHFTTHDIPHKFEAGTPHIAGAIGLGAAIDFINEVTMKKIMLLEHELTLYLFEKMRALPFVKMYGEGDLQHHLPICAFTMDRVHPHDISDILGDYGICIRAGHHCAMPFHHSLGVPATARASLAFYNTKREIDIFIDALKEIHKMFQ